RIEVGMSKRHAIAIAQRVARFARHLHPLLDARNCLRTCAGFPMVGDEKDDVSFAARFGDATRELVDAPERIPRQPGNGPAQFLEESCVVVMVNHSDLRATNNIPSISNSSSFSVLKSPLSLLRISAMRFESCLNFPGAYSTAGSSRPVGST